MFENSAFFACLYMSTLGHGSIKTYFRGFREIDEVGVPGSKSNQKGNKSTHISVKIHDTSEIAK